MCVFVCTWYSHAYIYILYIMSICIDMCIHIHMHTPAPLRTCISKYMTERQKGTHGFAFLPPPAVFWSIHACHILCPARALCHGGCGQIRLVLYVYVALQIGWWERAFQTAAFSFGIQRSFCVYGGSTYAVCWQVEATPRFMFLDTFITAAHLWRTYISKTTSKY